MRAATSPNSLFGGGEFRFSPKASGEGLDESVATDTEERKLRLQQEIAEPLRMIVATEFPRLDQHLSGFEAKLRQAPPMPADPAPLTTAADDVLAQADETIAQLEAVLKKMLDLETYNELVNLVRDLIRDQEVIRDRISQERKRQALEDLQ